ncbi:cytochrome c [Muricauda sp. NFXS6]|uniref:c-type cytochrome n=1 Tax=Allomuricauda sp. NFXS6 TaxID=2819094 RepID=UPI0032DE4B3F
MRNIVLVIFLGSALSIGNGPIKLPDGHSLSEVLTKHLELSFFSTKNQQEKSIPEVTLHLSENENLTWGSFIRYSIEVSDEEDGESKYGEILKNKVLLEIEFKPIINENGQNHNTASNKTEPNNKGLSLMMESNCFACHADKKAMTGPSFYEIAGRYEKNQNNITFLANHILEGSSGQWGSMEMPSYPNLTVEETEKIAAFILTQGSRRNQQILTGMEGVFQIMEKPDGTDQGVYILKASYTSSSLMKGQHSITLQIK